MGTERRALSEIQAGAAEKRLCSGSPVSSCTSCQTKTSWARCSRVKLRRSILCCVGVHTAMTASVWVLLTCNES